MSLINTAVGLPIGLRLSEGMEVSHPEVETDAGSMGVVPISLTLLAGPEPFPW